MNRKCSYCDDPRSTEPATWHAGMRAWMHRLTGGAWTYCPARGRKPPEGDRRDA